MKKIVIAGGSGFLGRLLSKYFAQKEIEVVVLSRRHHIDKGSIRYVKWDGERMGNWSAELDGADALINLNGKSVDCRYNEANKQTIYDTRLESTRVLGIAIEECERPPKVWLNASSATIYRHSEDKEMDEFAGELGDGFSVDVCQKWEKVFFECDTIKTRKVALRTAIVLGKHEGALQPLKRLVKFGFGGRQGSGHQFFSWIDEHDFVSAVDFLLNRKQSEGVYNLSSPNPVRNVDFMKELRKSIGLLIGLPIPKIMLEMGAFLIRTETELILKSRRVVPSKLLSEGFNFKYSHLSQSLNSLISKS